jgi:hypothetical protein
MQFASSQVNLKADQEMIYSVELALTGFGW